MDLTIAADTGAAFTGTSVADSIDGSLDSGNQTLHGFDSIDGAGGTDTLTATIGSTLTVEPTLTSVEVVNLQYTAAGTLSLDAAPDVTDLKVYASTVSTAVTNIESNVNLTLEDVVGSNTAAFTFKNDALGSATSVLTLNTDGSTATVDINVGGSDVFTTATVNSTGSASVLTLDALDTVTGLTITGDAALTLASTNSFTAITSITSTSTGAFTIDLDDAAGAYTLTLGSGADTITADTANTGTGGRTITMGDGNDTLDLGTNGSEGDDVFTGGGGVDTLVMADASDITLALTAGVSGFERLTASELADHDMAAFRNDSFTTLRFAGTGDGALDFSNVSDSVTTLELASSTATDGAADAGDDVTMTRLVDGTANSITVVAGITGVTAIQIGDELEVDQEETVTLDVNQASLTLNTGLSADDMTALVVVGDNAVDLSTVSSTVLRTVDLSGLNNANFTADISAATNVVTVTANTATTNSGAYNIVFGASDDVVTGTNNADTFDGNGGNDTFTLGGGADTVIIDAQGADTITDFTVGTGGDQIDIGEAAIGALIGGDALDDVAAQATVVEFVTGAETLAAGDNIIVLSGTTFATAALAGAALEAGGSREITFGNATTQGDDIIFVWSDGTDSYVTAGNINSTATTITAANLTETVLLTLSGIDHTELEGLVGTNFDLI
jgi:hypothetical protein